MVLHMEIAFTNGLTLATCNERSFLGDAGIDGCITLTDPTGLEFDAVKISLEGLLVNTIRCLDWYADSFFQKAQTLLQLGEVKRATDFAGPEEQRKGPRKCFFHFEIPKSLHSDLLGEDDGTLPDLPASIPRFERGQQHPILQPRCQGECKVVYALTAHVVRQNRVLARRTQAIKIIPTLDSRPPICIADFPGEYNLARSSCRRWWFPGADYRRDLRIEATQPAPLVLGHPTESAFLSTRLNLTQTTDKARDCRQGKPTDLVSCQCSGSLVSSTFVSSVPRQSAPTLKELSSSRTLSHNCRVCAKGQSAVQFSTWKKVACTVRGEDGAPKVMTQWKTDACVTLELGTVEDLVPSFESSLVSRRYKLVLLVRIAGPRRCTFRLTLPVQIYYRTNDLRVAERLLESECPPYVV